MSTANKHETFVESAPFTGEGFRLDKEAGIVHGVAICGFVSRNGRDYPKSVLARDHKKYEGAAVNLNHFEGERRVTDYLGRLQNVRIRQSDGKPIGDLKYVKNSPFTPQFEERVEDHPRSFGLSHVAVCQTKRVNGREVIEALSVVRSVDLVSDPATNSGLFESTNENPAMEQELAEAKSQLTAAQTELAALKEQVKTATEQLTALTSENATLKITADQAAVAALFAEAGVVPADVQRKAVSALTDPAERKALVESFKAASQGQKPVSQERPTDAGKKSESVTVPTDGKAFAEFIK